MSIMARLLISSTAPTTYSQLSSAAGVIAGELAYARSLAVGNNSSYRFDIDTTGNCLILSHTGADTTLNTLPKSPYRSPTDPSNQYIVAMANLPRLGSPVTVLGAGDGQHDAEHHLDRIWALRSNHAGKPKCDLADGGQRATSGIYLGASQSGDGPGHRGLLSNHASGRPLRQTDI